MSAVLNVKELASLLRVSDRTIYAAVRAGTIPGVVRVGVSIRFGRKRIQEWLSNTGIDVDSALGQDLVHDDQAS